MPSKEYLAYIASPAWQSKSLFVKQTWKERCYVCRWDWKEKPGRYLTVHHVRYRNETGESILGKEGPRDLVPLCDRHHVKGRCGWDTLRLMKVSYLAGKILRWLLVTPLKLAWRLLRFCVLFLVRARPLRPGG